MVGAPILHPVERQVGESPMKLRNVNTTDIGAAIQAGARTMASVFNADDDDIPFFRSEVWPDPHLAFSSVHSEAHVPGRHLNALLTAGVPGFRHRRGGGRQACAGRVFFLWRTAAIAAQP